MIPLRTGPVPATADAVIIGGGINGLCTAYELAKLGVKRIVVLEKHYIGSRHAPAAAAAASAPSGPPRRTSGWPRRSVRMYENMSAELGYQVFFRQGGYLMVTEQEEHLPAMKDAVALQNRCGVPTEFLRAARVPEDRAGPGRAQPQGRHLLPQGRHRLPLRRDLGLRPGLPAAGRGDLHPHRGDRPSTAATDASRACRPTAAPSSPPW